MTFDPQAETLLDHFYEATKTTKWPTVKKDEQTAERNFRLQWMRERVMDGTIKSCSWDLEND